MPNLWDDIPITRAVGPDGKLRHVDDVPNGNACGCLCPDPLCRQPLTAKQGKKKIHHFAHISGSQECHWAAENVISRVAAEVVRRNGLIVFPDLECYDPRCGTQLLTASEQVRISSVELVRISGRLNSDLAIRCHAGTAKERRFLAVICLKHPVEKYVNQLIASGLDVFAIDFRRVFEWRKKELGKHYDRDRIFEEFQDPGFLESVLVHGDGECMSWVINARSLAESKRRHDSYREQLREEREREITEAKARAQEAAILAKQQEETRAAETEKRELLERQRRLEERKETGQQPNAAPESQPQSRSQVKEEPEPARTATPIKPNFIYRKGEKLLALPLEHTTQKPYAQGCPLHGRADTVVQCGAYSYSTTRCEYFDSIGDGRLYCSAPTSE